LKILKKNKKKEKKEKFDTYVYKKLQSENGKKGDEMFYSLLCSVFDEEIARVESNFNKYLIVLAEQ